MLWYVIVNPMVVILAAKPRISDVTHPLNPHPVRGTSVGTGKDIYH